MPDRVPVGTVPGLVSALVGVDILVATLGVAATVSRVLLRQTNYDDSGATDTSVTASIRNATGGGGSGINCNIADQAQSAVATGSLAVAASESIYLRVSATGGAVSMNLTGWIEISGAAGVTTALTTLARVKQFLGITGSGDDDLINNLIASVSDEIQQWLGQKILQTTATTERITSHGKHHAVYSRFYPIISIASLTEDGDALVEGTGFEAKEQDLAAGRIVRIDGNGDPKNWAAGDRIVVATYDHGYATVPGAIVQAATELVAFDYRQSQPGGGRFGLSGKSLETGGTSLYPTRPDLWKAQLPRLGPYQVAA